MLTKGFNDFRVLNGNAGTQVNKSAAANNNTVDIHVVTAGKKFYLTRAGLNSYGPIGNFIVADAAGVEQYKILGVAPSTAENVPCLPPIEIPAGWKIQVQSLAAAIVVGYVGGWEEDV
jgi:hypothetical protein